MDTLAIREPIYPLHGLLLGFPIALFTAAAVTDVTYLNTSEIQWSNFSAWLIAGGLFFGGFAAVWALVGAVRRRARPQRRRSVAYLLLLLAMWIIGFVNALLHSRDAWYSVTITGAVLSMVTATLALIAGWIAYSGFALGEAR